VKKALLLCVFLFCLQSVAIALNTYPPEDKSAKHIIGEGFACFFSFLSGALVDTETPAGLAYGMQNVANRHVEKRVNSNYEPKWYTIDDVRSIDLKTLDFYIGKKATIWGAVKPNNFIQKGQQVFVILTFNEYLCKEKKIVSKSQIFLNSQYEEIGRWDGESVINLDEVSPSSYGYFEFDLICNKKGKV